MVEDVQQVPVLVQDAPRVFNARVIALKTITEMMRFWKRRPSRTAAVRSRVIRWMLLGTKGTCPRAS
jgi:hypothetical protein